MIWEHGEYILFLIKVIIVDSQIFYFNMIFVFLFDYIIKEFAFKALDPD